MREQMYETIVDGCAYGLRDRRSGELLQKNLRICSTDDTFPLKNRKKCSSRRGRGDNHAHAECTGGATVAASAYYPRPLCKAWAQHSLQHSSTLEDGKAISLLEDLEATESPTAEDQEHELLAELTGMFPAGSQPGHASEDDYGQEHLGVPGASAEEETQREVRLSRLHRNIGHPINDAMVDIL